MRVELGPCLLFQDRSKAKAISHMLHVSVIFRFRWWNLRETYSGPV